MNMLDNLVAFFQPVNSPSLMPLKGSDAVQMKLVDMTKIATLFAMSFVLYAGLSQLQ